MTILAWPLHLWQGTRHVHHWLIAQFDKNQWRFMWCWVPLTFVGCTICIAIGAFTLLSVTSMYLWYPIMFICCVLYLPLVSVFFLTFFMLMQAFYGFIYAVFGIPVIRKAEILSKDFVSLFRSSRENAVSK